MLNRRKPKRNLVSKIKKRFSASSSPPPSGAARPVSSGGTPDSEIHSSRGRSWEIPYSNLNKKIRSGIRSISADRLKFSSEIQHTFATFRRRK